MNHLGGKDSMTETIIIRVEKQTKSSIKQIASDDRRTLSNYLRKLFQEDIDKNKKLC